VTDKLVIIIQEFQDGIDRCGNRVTRIQNRGVGIVIPGIGPDFFGRDELRNYANDTKFSTANSFFFRFEDWATAIPGKARAVQDN
jgi:hypothetical protein